MKNHNLSQALLIKNMSFSVLCKPALMFLQICYTPLVLAYLGVEKYGVWVTLLSIFSWINYCDIGIGNGLKNKLSETIALKDEQKSNQLISSTYFICVFVIILISIFLSILILNLNWNRIFSIVKMDENLQIIILLSVNLICFNLLLSLCKNILFALQKAAMVSFISVAVQILNLLIIIFIGRFENRSLLLLSVTYCLSMLFINCIVTALLFKKYPFSKPKLKNINIPTGRKIMRVGLIFFAMQLSAMIMFTTDNILVANLFGAKDVTPYSIVNTVFAALTSLHAAILSPVWSFVTMKKAKGEYDEILKLLNQLLLLIPCFIIAIAFFVIYFKPIANIWLKQALDYPRGLIFLGGIYCLLTVWCNTYAAITNGLELLKPFLVMGIVQAVSNILFSLFFVKVLGMDSKGILLGTIIAMLLSVIFSPVLCVGHIKKCKIKLYSL